MMDTEDGQFFIKVRRFSVQHGHQVRLSTLLTYDFSAELGPLCPDAREGFGKCSSTTTPTGYEKWLVSNCARRSWKLSGPWITNSHEPTLVRVVVDNFKYTRSSSVSTIPDFCLS
jgi:hypothetical protein